MKWAAGLICALPFIIAWWGCRVFGQRLDPPTERDSFIYGIALQFREPGLCKKIARYAPGSGGGFSAGYQISYLQSNCYYNLAVILHDASLCEQVRPITRGFLDGSKYNPQDCRAHLYSIPVIGVVDPHIIVARMRKLGYLDQEIHDYQYRRREGNPVYDAYSRLRKDSLFAERIQAAPAFDEPIEAAKVRPANDLEYVYQMFAVDSDDAIFCDKISPNVEAEWPNQKRFMLKLECNRAIALDKRDVSVCEKLPTRSNLPPGGPDSDSREACRHDIEGMRPDGGHTRYGPAFPPTFSSFQNGLHELGYNLTFPELTWSDYGDFLEYLSDTRQPNAAPRAKLLERVAAME